MSQIGSEWFFRKILLRILNKIAKDIVIAMSFHDFAQASLLYFPEIPHPSCNIRVIILPKVNLHLFFVKINFSYVSR